MNLSAIRCASVTEVKLWAEAARQCNATDRGDLKRDPLALFCSDGDPVWCRRMAEAGLCCISTTRKRSTEYLREQAEAI